MQTVNPPSKFSFRQVATLVAILGGVVVNTLSNFFPIKGLNIGQLSNQLFGSVLIIPANYAFAIWGLIYLGLVAFGVYQYRPSQRQSSELDDACWLLVVASIAQMIWIGLFEARLFMWSVVPILGILLPLMGMYRRLEIGKRPVSRTVQWLVHAPISLYLGWISVATVVNVAIGLYSLNWTGWGVSSPVWTVLMIVISSGIAFAVAIQKGDPVFPLVIVWALVAIAVRQWSFQVIAGTAMGLAIGLAVLVWVLQLKGSTFKRSKSSAVRNKSR
jgi:hypothetical protein